MNFTITLQPSLAAPPAPKTSTRMISLTDDSTRMKEEHA